MGEISGEWLFVVWIWILVLMLVVMGIRAYRVRRNMPKNPGNKRTNRKHALDNLKFFLGIKGNDNGDNPMNNQVGDNGTFLK